MSDEKSFERLQLELPDVVSNGEMWKVRA